MALIRKKQTMRQKCKRCGYIGGLLEKHHKKQKVDGGSDSSPNRIWYCVGCHDYEHARRKIIEAIEVEQDRIAVLNKRLEILDRLNSPQQVKKRGYQGYFKDFSKPLPSPSECVRGISGYVLVESKNRQGSEDDKEIIPL